MKKSILYCILFLGLVPLTNAQELSYFMDLALKDNLKVQAKVAEIEADETIEDQFNAWQDPVLSTGYNVLPEGMERGHVSVMQNFQWFGTTKHQKAAAREMVRSESQRLMALKKQIKVNVALLYLEIQKAEQQLKVKTKMLKNLKYLEKLARNRLSTSKGTTVDVIRAQLATEKTALGIENLKKKRTALSFSLNKLVDRNGQDSIFIVPVTESMLLERSSLEQHPEIAAVDYQIKQNKEKTAVAQKKALPNLGIGLEYMRMKPTGNELMPMVSISLPIFRKKYKARIEETKRRKVAYEKERAQKIQQMESERNRLRSEVSQTKNELALLQRQLEKLKTAEELLLTYYSTSGEDFKDIIELKQEEISYRSSIVDAEIKLLKLKQQIDYYH